MDKSCRRFVSVSCTAMLLLVVTGGVCRAALVEYTIDNSKSSLTISGAFWVLAPSPSSIGVIAEQVSGSLADSYGGTITADKIGTDLFFSGGSTIAADEHPAGRFVPAAGGSVDNYGMEIATSLDATVFGAFRDITMDFTGSLSIGANPSSMNISLPSFVIDNEIPSTFAAIFGTSSAAAANYSSGVATLEIIGDKQWLTIPILWDGIVEGDQANVGSVELRYTLAGEMVAYRVVPEPATWVLMGLGLIGLVAGARRKFGR